MTASRTKTGEEAAGDLLAASCPGCGFPYNSDSGFGCRDCLRKYGPALIKAAVDYFDYAVKLRTGETLFFHTAELHGDWVLLLDENESAEQTWEQTIGVRSPRGLCVHLDAIVWASDAPWGS